jgi:TolB protein
VPGVLDLPIISVLFLWVTKNSTSPAVTEFAFLFFSIFGTLQWYYIGHVITKFLHKKQTEEKKLKRTITIGNAVVILAFISFLAWIFIIGTRKETGLPIDADPSLSGDNEKIVFSAKYKDKNDVYTIHKSGSELRKLTKEGNNKQAAFSNDSSKIIFISDRDNDKGEIYIMNSDGSGQKRVTNNLLSEWKPSFSPDGSKIVFSSEGEFHIMNVNGTEERRIPVAVDTYTGCAFQFSSDNKFIIVPGRGKALFIDISEPKPSFITKSYDCNDENIVLSPDRGKVGYTMQTNDILANKNTYDLFIMNADGSNRRRLTNIGSIVDYWAFSPDSKKIVFLADAKKGPPAHDIWVVDVDGTNLQRIDVNPKGLRP